MELTDPCTGSGHWYEGGGIRWNVHLVGLSEPVHIARHGAFVVSQLSASGQPASVEIAPTADGTAADPVHAVFSLYDRNGTAVTSCATNTAVVHSVTKQSCSLLIPSVELWSVQQPTLYTVKCTVYVGGSAVDAVEWHTGFRNATFTADQGLLLNGRRVHFRGFSHHDSFLATGVAMPPRLDLFRAQASRMLGGNVWRMSHNPYHPPLYYILDALGTLVWDENRDLGPWYTEGMGDMVRRDRNHPSIVLWSFCNEDECKQNEATTGFMFRNATLAQDVSRPTASNGVGWASISGVDVQGLSHASSPDFVSLHHKGIPTVLRCVSLQSSLAWRYICTTRSRSLSFDQILCVQ